MGGSDPRRGAPMSVPVVSPNGAQLRLALEHTGASLYVGVGIPDESDGINAFTIGSGASAQQFQYLQRVRLCRHRWSSRQTIDLRIRTLVLIGLQEFLHTPAAPTPLSAG